MYILIAHCMPVIIIIESSLNIFLHNDYIHNLLSFFFFKLKKDIESNLIQNLNFDSIDATW